jgi:hypothetical protein
MVRTRTQEMRAVIRHRAQGYIMSDHVLFCACSRNYRVLYLFARSVPLHYFIPVP